MRYFWDTSAIASFLFEEESSRLVRAYDKERKALRGYVSFFSELELESVFQRKLNRGEILKTSRDDFRVAVLGIFSVMTVLFPDIIVSQVSKRLISEYYLRSADALQLGTARLLFSQDSDVSFICLDKKLNKVAKAEGFTVPFLS